MLKIIRYGLILWMSSALVVSAANTDRTDRIKQKQGAEQERAALLKKLEVLKRDIQKTETVKESVADALSESEQTISETNRALKDLSGERKKTQAQLDQLSQEEAHLTEQIQTQQKQLAQLVRKQYVAGNEDRIKLLLSGEDPNRMSRELSYIGYLSRAQTKLIDALRLNLAQIQQTQSEVHSAQEALSNIAQDKQNQKKKLEQEQSKHAALLSTLSSKLADQRKQVDFLRQNEQRLSSLVTKLADLIEEQKKQARDKKNAPLVAHEKKRATSTSQNIDNDSLEQGIFVRLRGQLKLPVRGEVAARFGSKRGEGEGGLSWKGLFIRAAEGAEVHAVAPGRVVFADWLRGFGNVLIIDHGDQYMTIYGNNQAILKHVGDSVKTGDSVASVGSSGGNVQAGLYFEIRHQGRAFDPLEWITVR